MVQNKKNILDWDDDNNKERQDNAFKLHVGPAKEPIKIGEKDLIKKEFKKPAAAVFTGERKISEKIWGLVRFISTSAIFFIILFFLMNWNAYQAIIMNKFGLLKPTAEQQEVYEKLPVSTDVANTNQSTQTQTQQDLMDLSKNPEEQKSQIPELNIEVAPPDTRIIIPRINKNVPVVTISTEALINKEWDRLEQQIQEGLRDGVVHYPGTAFPGEKGNIVITGHSSYFVWDPGRFKDVFSLLHEVNIGDRVYIYYNQKKYIYEVYDIKIVLPTQVDVLTQGGEDKLTLITCTPVGTNLKRLVVVAREVK